MQVDQRDRDHFKFLWINRHQPQLCAFRFKVVLFEATCSSYLLQEIIQTHLKDNVLGNRFADKFYVDNYLNTYDRECNLINDKAKLDELMLDANMPLQEWVSNDETFNLLYLLDIPITKEYSRNLMGTIPRHSTYNTWG